MDIELKNGIYHLSGRIDEHSVLDSLLQATEPLKLNLGRISTINSIGVRKFLAFTLAWSPKRFEFYDCTPEFIVNVNVIPQMLGSPSDSSQIKSFYVPFSCENCRRAESILFGRADLTSDALGEFDVPPQLCNQCGEPLDLDVEKTEFFQFLDDEP